MRRYAFFLLFVIVLLVPFVLRAVMGSALRDEADASGLARSAPMAGRLVVVTPHNQDIRREFARAFLNWHVEQFGERVEIDYRTPGGTNDIRRLLETTYRGWRDAAGKLPAEVPADIHVVWGGGDFFFANELPQDILLAPELPAGLLAEAFPEPTLAGVKLYDARRDAAGAPLPPKWVGVCLSSFGIVYNPDAYGALGLAEPAAWHDLTDPRLAGFVALADPTHSGSAAVAYMMVLQRAMADAEAAFLAGRGANELTAELRNDPAYVAAIAEGWKRGMGDLLLIAANARYFTDSASQVPNDVGNGEAAAGMAIDFYGRVYQESVGPSRCRFVAPRAATAITPDPVGILYGVKGVSLKLANRFVHFLLTPQGQRLWITRAAAPGGPVHRALRRPPIRRDVYADRAGWSDDVNPFAEAGGFNQRVEWMVLFGDTRPIWAAAWIDGREALKSAYRKVLSVPDAARRDALLRELADLPITLKDVETLRAQRKKIEAEQGHAEEWKARQRIDWAKRFRDHYEAVAAKSL